MDSSAVVNKVWKKEHFKEAIRVQAAMLSHDDDVLTPEAMLKVHTLRIPAKTAPSTSLNETANFVPAPRHPASLCAK